MAEVFANEFLAALDGAVDDDTLSFDLTEAPPAALALGTWRLRIGTIPSASDPEPDFELCQVDGLSTSGATVTVTRGAEGTTSTAWPAGTPVAAVLTAAALASLGSVLDFGEAGDIASSAFGDSAAAGSTGEVADAGHRHAREANPLTAHLAADDPHTQYLTAAEGAAAFDSLGAAAAAAASSVQDGDVAGGVLAGTYPNPSFAADMATQAELDAHAGAADPHQGYLTAAEGAAAFDAIGAASAAQAASQPLDSDLTAIAALATTAYGRALLALADAAAARTAIGAGWTETEVDFGSDPVYSKSFTVTAVGVTAGSRIIANASGNVATGRVGNDLEWDSLLLAALPGTGDFQLTALAVPGPVVGRRKVFYQVT